MGWLACYADTSNQWLFTDMLNNVHVEKNGDFSQCEKITHTGALLIGTCDRFTYGDPAGFLKNINDHMPTAAQNRLIFIEKTGHTYQQKEQEVADAILQLVRDVSDFMTQEERALPPELGIPRYNRRLAGIYKSEEPIGNLPMNMEGFHLFDPLHRSSRPLCLAWHAAKLTNPEKAEQFLINLRAATVLQNRPTTHREVILEIVNETGMDTAAFQEHFLNGSAEAALEEDRRFAQRLGIHALPAYLLSHEGQCWILPFLTSIEEFSLILDRLLKGSAACAPALR